MKYRKYSSRYESKVVELLNQCFPKRNITIESFRWKHFQNTTSKKVVAFIATDKNKVCSFVCFNPLIISFRGKSKIFYSCTVQATHPEYRRKGIVSDLTKIIENRLAKSADYIGFSNNSGVQIDLHSKKINYKILDRLKTKYFIAKKSRKSFKAEQISFDMLCKYLDLNKPNNYIQIDKSKKYLEWKFLRNPKRKFIFLNITNKDVHVGTVIYSVSKLKLEVYELLLHDSMYIREVIITLQDYAFSKNKIFVSFTFMENDFWKRFLPQAQLTRRINFYFTVKSKSEQCLNKESWLIQGGDIQ